MLKNPGWSKLSRAVQYGIAYSVSHFQMITPQTKPIQAKPVFCCLCMAQECKNWAYLELVDYHVCWLTSFLLKEACIYFGEIFGAYPALIQWGSHAVPFSMALACYLSTLLFIVSRCLLIKYQLEAWHFLHCSVLNVLNATVLAIHIFPNFIV